MQFGPHALAAIAIGILAELTANSMRLWVYTRPSIVLINLFVVYGLIMAAIATLVPREGLLTAFALGALVGLAYEGINLQVLHWWSFPNQCMGFVRGHASILAVLTILWGLVPPAAWAIAHVAGHRPARLSEAERFDALQGREQQLMDKLRALQQRETEIENALEVVRSKKKRFGDKFEVRNPAAVTATP